MVMDDERRWLQVSAMPDVWSWSSRSPNFFDLRMIAFRLKGGGVVVVSPVPDLDESTLAELDSFGPLTAIIAPNYYHNLGIKPLLKRYPAVKLLAHEKAIPRLEKVTGLNFEKVDQLSDLFPDGLKMACPDGLKQGEIWFYTEARGQNPGLLAVCDCYFNMKPGKSFVLDKVFRLANTYPGLRVSRVFGFMAIADRDLYKEWIRRFFSANKPTLLIPSHGEIYQSLSLAQELADLVRA
jgi:hypothetical protein